MAEPGILGAYEPVAIPHTSAKEPPRVDFGLESLGAGWKGGNVGTDYGLHQAAYEGDIWDIIREEGRKKGIDVPPSLISHSAAVAMDERLVRASSGDLDILGPVRRPRYEDTRKFWARIRQERDRDPAFLKDFPTIIDFDSLQAEARRRRGVDEEAANEVYAKSTTGGKTAWWMGNFATAAKDPLSYLPIGSTTKAGTSVAAAIIEGTGKGIALNSGVTLAMEPATRIDAAARGQDRTLKDTAIDVGMSGLFGGLLEGAHAGVEAKFGVTTGQRSAVNVVDRDEQVRASSPFERTPAGDAEHGKRLASAMAALEMGQQVPKFTRGQLMSGTSLGGGAERFRAMVSAAEDGGKANARPIDPKTGRARSDAMGWYQFTEKTWLTYYKREIGAGGLTDAQILAKRSDKPTADRLMNALTQDNRNMLAAAGLPDSATNLYMAHFLGPKGMKVIRAAPETPVSELLPATFIKANPEALRGKTAGEVMAWADRKMGGQGVVPEAPDAPVLRDDIFADDDQYRTALDTLELTERLPDDDGSSFVLPEQPLALEKGQAPLLRTLAEMGGIADTEGHNLLGGRNLQRFVPGVGPLIRKKGMTIDAVGERLWEQGWFGPSNVTPRPSEDEILDLVERAVRGDVWHPEVAATAMEVQRQRWSPTEQAARDEITSVVNDLLPGVDIDDDVMDLALSLRAQGEEASSAYMQAAEQFARDYVHAAKAETDDFDYDIPGFDDDRPIIDREAGQGGGRPTSDATDPFGSGAVPEGPEGYSGPRARDPSTVTAEQTAAAVEAEGDRFSDPNGSDAVEQADSITHDLAAETMADITADDIPDADQFYIGEDGRTITVAEALAEIEADEAAIKAVKDCL